MKKIRPFWSNDVVKTEMWLDTMSKKGWALKSLHFRSGIFEFETCNAIKPCDTSKPCDDARSCDAANKKHRIVYQKGFPGIYESIPNNFIEDGYEKNCCGKNYYVLSTDKDPQNTPSYAGFLERNQKRAYVIGTISLIGSVWFTLAFLILFISVGSVLTGDVTIESMPQENVQVVFSWYDLVISIVQFLPFAIYIFCVGTWFKLHKTNKQLVLLCGEKVNLKFTMPVELIRSKEEINNLKDQKLLIKKTKRGWFYAPDKVEIWLENMEAKGFNLCYMSKFGNSFYFVKGTPRKMKYVVDNQKCAMPEYFNINQDAGWKLIFRSLTRSDSYVVWAQEVTGDRLLFMSDAKENMKRSRRLALMYGISYGFCIVMYILSIIPHVCVLYQSHRPVSSGRYFLIGTFMLLIIEFGYFIINAIAYYFRMKKKYKEFGDIHY